MNECRHCGMPIKDMWDAVWSPAPKRDMFCSEECMEAERKYENS